MGAITQMKGTALSFTLNLVKSPKVYSPNNGPYVYPANVNIFAITLSSAIKYLKIRITAMSTAENKTCIFFLIFSCF